MRKALALLALALALTVSALVSATVSTASASARPPIRNSPHDPDGVGQGWICWYPGTIAYGSGGQPGQNPIYRCSYTGQPPSGWNWLIVGWY